MACAIRLRPIQRYADSKIIIKACMNCLQNIYEFMFTYSLFFQLKFFKFLVDLLDRFIIHLSYFTFDFTCFFKMLWICL